MGLHFDTKVANKITDDVYNVTETSAKAWVMMNKNIIKKSQGQEKWRI